MDKDSVILKYEQENTSNLEKEISSLSEGNRNQRERLDLLQAKLDVLYQKTETEFSGKDIEIKRSGIKSDHFDVVESYDDLFLKAYDSLKIRGLFPEDMNYSNLISDEELQEIIDRLNTPLPRAERWVKSDLIVVFIAALVGGFADFILGNRDNKFTGKDSPFSKMLNEIHTEKFPHASNAPIDYQGKHFGGGYHRELSKGHDLLRFVEGIKMFKTGTFEAIRYENGTAIKVFLNANQYGKPYEQLSTIEAICNYSHHMFADFFSTYSLPFPGYSFFTESSNRNLRKLSADMYHQGFNCKNIVIQSVSAIAIEAIVRVYFSIQSVEKYKDSIEIAEDYSNFEAIKEFVNPTSKEKLNEMLLVSHAIVMGLNTGKIVINKNFAEINIAEILSVVKYGIKVVNAAIARNNKCSKLIYHTEQVQFNWAEIENEIINVELDVLNEFTEVLVIA